MPFSSWPVDANLAELLASAGLDASGLNLEAHLAAAVDRLEDKGYRPFLPAAEATERRFDAPGSRQSNRTLLGGGQLLSLRGGAVAIESVSIDTGNGPTLLAAGRWFPAPSGAPDNNEPYTVIRFPSATFSIPEGVIVKARWGYAEQIPGQAWNTVLHDAALAVLPLLGNAQVMKALQAVSAQEGVQIKAKESGPLRIEYQTVDPLKAATFEPLFRSWIRSRESGFARYGMEEL